MPTQLKMATLLKDAWALPSVSGCWWAYSCADPAQLQLLRILPIFKERSMSHTLKSLFCT